jgi:transposase
VDLSQKQLQKIVVIENAVAGRMGVREAAEALSRSERQVKRLKQRYQADNPAWGLHGNHGRAPANRTSMTIAQRVIELAKGKYAGFNDSHLSEKLAGEEGIALSRSTVRRILRSAGLRSPQKRRPPRYRSRRARRQQEGMLLLIDGSWHAWLEQRGPWLTLLGLVDDATGKVAAAHFQAERENTAGYLRLLRTVVETHGIPLALYRDQHSTLRSAMTITGPSKSNWPDSSFPRKSDGPWNNLAWRRSWPARRKPRAASNGPGAPSRTA